MLTFKFFLRRKLVFTIVAFLTLLLLFRPSTRSAEAEVPPNQPGDVFVGDSDKTLGSKPTLKAPIDNPSYHSIFSFSSQPKKSSPIGDLFTHILNSNPPPGYVVFSCLYLFEGTFYAVVRDEESKQGFPPLKFILSRPVRMEVSPNDPTDSEIQVLTEEEALPVLGPLNEAISIGGASFILHEQSQFMHHYYHWWGEIILGAIRSYTSLALDPNMESPLMEPSRFILPNVPDSSWRDHAGMVGPLMRAAFPSANIENADYWEDLITLQRPFVFERALVIDRISAHKSPLASIWYKMVSSTMAVTVPKQFWEPLRKRVIRNVVHSSGPQGVPDPSTTTSLPLVLYISRQSTDRRLLDSAHEDLVRALKQLEKEGICQVQIPKMESLSISEQFHLVGRAVVMIGVHGNGLTHQLWMPPSPRSTVIEITYPQTYVHDYSILSRNMGHKHYAIWNASTVTFPEGNWYKGINIGHFKDFHGNSIPVDGNTVANVVRDRLRGSL